MTAVRSRRDMESLVPREPSLSWIKWRLTLRKVGDMRTGPISGMVMAGMAVTSFSPMAMHHGSPSDVGDRPSYVPRIIPQTFLIRSHRPEVRRADKGNLGMLRFSDAARFRKSLLSHGQNDSEPCLPAHHTLVSL